jgi:hypothetical protein
MTFDEVIFVEAINRRNCMTPTKLLLLLFRSSRSMRDRVHVRVRRLGLLRNVGSGQLGPIGR